MRCSPAFSAATGSAPLERKALRLKRAWRKAVFPVKPHAPRCVDLPEICDEFCSHLEELDPWAVRGVVRDIRATTGYSRLIPDALWTQLSWPERHPQAAQCPKRDEWFEGCLHRFRAMLAPPAVRFTAEKRESGLLLCPHAGETVRMRIDQAVAQRQWGIEIHSAARALDEFIARQCLATAFHRLVSDLASINQLCAEWDGGASFLSQLAFTTQQVGNRFEQLMLAVLNEPALTASPATIYKDVRQWTDIRARLPHGGMVRIQTKLVNNVAEHDEEVARHPRAGDVLVLSPVEIARYLEAHFDPVEIGCAWPEFLRLFAFQVNSLQGLSTAIFRLFYQALSQPAAHPLDPVASLPRPIKRAIIHTVARRAAEMQKSVEDASGTTAADVEREPDVSASR